jgi:hypothetical protein
MEVWQHRGIPTDEEIQQWMEIDGDLSDHLAIRHICPTCGSLRTRWIRNQYSICFNCESSFTLEETKDEEEEFWKAFR